MTVEELALADVDLILAHAAPDDKRRAIAQGIKSFYEARGCFTPKQVRALWLMARPFRYLE